MNKREDKRYGFGAFCTWSGPIADAHVWAALQEWTLAPVCPHCFQYLMQIESEEAFFQGVPGFDKEHPGYSEFMDWLKVKNRTKCYPSLDKAITEYNQETGNSFRLDTK